MEQLRNDEEEDPKAEGERIGSRNECLSNFARMSLCVCADLLWTAPELLRRGNVKYDLSVAELAKADIYSYGIILYEIYGREGPFGDDLIPAAGSPFSLIFIAEIVLSLQM